MKNEREKNTRLLHNENDFITRKKKFRSCKKNISEYEKQRKTHKRDKNYGTFFHGRYVVFVMEVKHV